MRCWQLGVRLPMGSVDGACQCRPERFSVGLDCVLMDRHGCEASAAGHLVIFAGRGLVNLFTSVDPTQRPVNLDWEQVS